MPSETPQNHAAALLSFSATATIDNEADAHRAVQEYFAAHHLSGQKVTITFSPDPSPVADEKSNPSKNETPSDTKCKNPERPNSIYHEGDKGDIALLRRLIRNHMHQLNTPKSTFSTYRGTFLEAEVSEAQRLLRMRFPAHKFGEAVFSADVPGCVDLWYWSLYSPEVGRAKEAPPGVDANAPVADAKKVVRMAVV